MTCALGVQSLKQPSANSSSMSCTLATLDVSNDSISFASPNYATVCFSYIGELYQTYILYSAKSYCRTPAGTAPRIVMVKAGMPDNMRLCLFGFGFLKMASSRGTYALSSVQCTAEVSDITTVGELHQVSCLMCTFFPQGRVERVIRTMGPCEY